MRHAGSLGPASVSNDVNSPMPRASFVVASPWYYAPIRSKERKRCTFAPASRTATYCR